MPKPTWYFERQAQTQGAGLVAGLDEVGRGCLFGPVVAAAVILDPSRPIRGLQDSKQIDARERETLADRIRERSIACSVAAVDNTRIDRDNILEASRAAMTEAYQRLQPAADYWLADAMELPVAQPGRAVIKGDTKSRSIAAASILAKVTRDAWVREWSVLYPEYGLATNAGYGTSEHLAALERLGPTPLHRLTFAPVARLMPCPAQNDLWSQAAAR